MRRNRIKQRIAQQTPSFGIGLLWPSPEIVELAGALGFEWLWLDLEHGPFDLATLSHTVRAAEAVDMDTIIRLPRSRDPEAMLPYLETGAMGVIMAHTQSAEDIAFAVNAVKYPPQGERSAGTMRGAGWGAANGFYEHSNRETMIMALVEDEIGIANLDAILAVDGLDAVVIGYGDLSLTMGHPGNKGHPEVQRVGRAAQAKVLASGKALQVTAQDGEEAAEWIARGALMVRCTAVTILTAGLRPWLEKAKAGAVRATGA
jgi:2-keto-3-deoxy-L-rhamnonate aldolase RhmA